MTDQHPITPPPDELVDQWRNDNLVPENLANYVATQAARWGADQELEACVEWVVGTIPSWAPHTFGEQLRDARRPKPPSLAEQALEQLKEIRSVFEAAYGGNLVDDSIWRALERLQELENNG